MGRRVKEKRGICGKSDEHLLGTKLHTKCTAMGHNEALDEGEWPSIETKEYKGKIGLSK